MAWSSGCGSSARCPREQLLDLLHEEDVDLLLFPSLRDQAGWVVAEALSRGIPVVCLDRGGPPTLGGRAVAPSSPARTARVLADEARRAVLDEAPQAEFGLQARADLLAELLRGHGLLPVPTTGQPIDGRAS